MHAEGNRLRNLRLAAGSAVAELDVVIVAVAVHGGHEVGQSIAIHVEPTVGEVGRVTGVSTTPRIQRTHGPGRAVRRRRRAVAVLRSGAIGIRAVRAELAVVAQVVESVRIEVGRCLPVERATLQSRAGRGRGGLAVQSAAPLQLRQRDVTESRVELELRRISDDRSEVALPLRRARRGRRAGVAEQAIEEPVAVEIHEHRLDRRPAVVVGPPVPPGQAPPARRRGDPGRSRGLNLNARCGRCSVLERDGRKIDVRLPRAPCTLLNRLEEAIGRMCERACVCLRRRLVGERDQARVIRAERCPGREGGRSDRVQPARTGHPQCAGAVVALRTRVVSTRRARRRPPKNDPCDLADARTRIHAPADVFDAAFFEVGDPCVVIGNFVSKRVNLAGQRRVPETDSRAPADALRLGEREHRPGAGVGPPEIGGKWCDRGHALVAREASIVLRAI